MKIIIKTAINNNQLTEPMPAWGKCTALLGRHVELVEASGSPRRAGALTRAYSDTAKATSRLPAAPIVAVSAGRVDPCRADRVPGRMICETGARAGSARLRPCAPPRKYYKDIANCKDRLLDAGRRPRWGGWLRARMIRAPVGPGGRFGSPATACSRRSE